MSRSPLSHIAAEEIRQLGERCDVELDHVLGALDRRFQKIAGKPYPALFSKISIATDLASRLAFQTAGRAGRAKIDRLDQRIHPYLRWRSEASLFIDSSRRATNTRIDLLRRQDICEFKTEAARCACDQSPFSGEAAY